MSLFHLNTFVIRHKTHIHSYPSFSASFESGKRNSPETNAEALVMEGRKERIRSLFNKVELSISAYDTAWVAMVPSPHSSQAPCFSRCVDWILANQLNDGSWGLPQQSVRWLKDDLSSTLACILALKRWGVGEEQIDKGLHFLESNFGSATDENQHSPLGFDIIFPGMLEYAEILNLKFPIDQTIYDAMLKRKATEIRRYSENRSPQSEAYLAYVSEGMGKSQNWDMVMKFQRKNGSLFNSPSTTAASLSHIQNTDCLNYLTHLLEKFGDAVPTVYPSDIYARLCMVDSLQRMGIDRYFRQEIGTVLDETYWMMNRYSWMSQLVLLAFRILRVNGYDILSDKLTGIAKEVYYCNLLDGHLKDTYEVLELYRASQTIIYPYESDLEKQKSWSKRFLEQKLYTGSVHLDKYAQIIFKEVEDALKFPDYANLERLVHGRGIKNYNTDSSWILKTSYISANISNTDLQRLALEDFNACQSIFQEELKLLESWVVESNLDKLEFARQRTTYCYYPAAAMLFPPELHEARMSWSKHSILAVVVDDFFDIGGSMKELLNLIQLLNKWNVNVHTECCSENVRIIFSALQNTICETGVWALKWQARNVTNHIFEFWMEFLSSVLKEAEWARDGYVPKLEEYMANGFISIALGPIVLPSVYLVEKELSENIFQNGEIRTLLKLMSTCGRLLNDIQSYKRESEQGKLNSVSLHMIHTDSEEAAIRDIKRIINEKRRELQRLVLQEKDSVVPRACKDLFWKMSRVVHFTYMKDDGFTLENTFWAVKAIIHEPISIDYD